MRAFSTLFVLFAAAAAQEGAEYLASAIRDLKTMNLGRRTDTLSYSDLKLRHDIPKLRQLAPEDLQPQQPAVYTKDIAYNIPVPEIITQQPESLLIQQDTEITPLLQHNIYRDIVMHPEFNVRASKRANDEQPIPEVQPEAPPLTLTKGELAAIYENAVNKGKTVKLDPGTGNVIHAAVHEIDSQPSSSTFSESTDTQGGDPGGYYYYYYPLKSFLDGNEAHQIEHTVHEDVAPHTHTAIQPQYHSHTHQHNVHIAPMKTGMSDNKKKALEPLFMAISGFVGMAVMFVLSAVILPKFGVLKSRGDQQQFSPQLSSLARVALMAIEGKGCSERIACEIGKTASAFHIYDNRFVKLIRRMSPMVVRRQIDKVGKYTDKKLKCTPMLCKKKPPLKPKQNAKLPLKKK